MAVVNGTEAVQKESLRLKVQRMGGFLSRMVMPNIGIFIAWGLITAFVIPTGWTPNENLAELVDPTMKYLLPLLIAFTGGRMVHGNRGGAIGALATMGVIIGSDITMLLGAMVMGPLAAWILKKIDALYAGKVRPGLEMLVDNFVLGIVGGVIMIIAYLAIEPIFAIILGALGAAVQWLMDMSLIPLLGILVPPGQVLFLNNAINHGIMIPLGIQEASETGKSLLFLVEANGGNFAGLLLAFWAFGKGVSKRTAPASFVIQFIGGIGEVAFPYVLVKPVIILAPIFGSVAGLTTLLLLDGGTVGPVSPGSIIALIAMSPRGGLFPNILAYVIAAAVSFLVAAVILKSDKKPDIDETVAPSDTSVTASEDADAVPGASAGSRRTAVSADGTAVTTRRIERVALICDAGMGSSAMGASILRSKITKAGLQVSTQHASMDSIPEDLDLVVTNKILEDRVTQRLGAADVPVWTLENMLSQPEYDAIVERIRNNNEHQ